MMDPENVIWHQKPELRKPWMLLAFDGWGNAGQVASAIAWYLLGRLKATLFAEIKPDEFFVYQTSGSEQKRPLVSIEKGVIKSLNIVTGNFSYFKNSSGDRDLIIVTGPEPEQRWVKYTGLLLDFAREFQVERIIALGGSFAAIPHTVPTRITAVVNQPQLVEELKQQGIEMTDYKGPSSIYSLLMVEAAKRDLPVISLWAQTPHYIQVINFIATYNLLLKLRNLLGIQLELADARKESEHLYSQIDQAIASKPELREHLKVLEQEYRKGNPQQPQASINQNIVKEIEELMKGHQGPEVGPQGPQAGL
jgi:proteasome assembly chaperone (PAC2) family protein